MSGRAWGYAIAICFVLVLILHQCSTVSLKRISEMTYRDLFWLFFGAILGCHVVKVVDKLFTYFIERGS